MLGHNQALVKLDGCDGDVLDSMIKWEGMEMEEFNVNYAQTVEHTSEQIY